MTTSLRAAVAAAALLLASGCGESGPARLKGRVVDGGEPPSLKGGGLTSLNFHRLVDGNPEPHPAYSCPLNPDGAFEVAVSGGEMTPGRYRVVVGVAGGQGKGPDRFKGAGDLKTSKLTVDLKSGSNEVTLDLANPGG